MNQEISVITAFTAGFLSFFAPCILPLIPPYLAWLLRIPQEELQNRNIKIKILSRAVLLVLGFSIFFIILGASASKLGQVLISHRLLAQKIGGLIIILFGLEFAGVLKIFKNHQAALIKKIFSKFNHKTSSFLVGLTFAFAWVACFSPILGSILVLTSFQGTLTQGIILLSFYSLGLAIPFLLTSLFLGLAMERIKVWQKITKWINLFSGLTLILLGILFFTDNFYKIVIWFSKLY